jgi:hypothetical protein
MTKTEKETSSFMQAKLSNLVNRISRGMSRPVSKFIRDMLFGICGNGTASVHKIAQNTIDGTSTKKTSERLYRNLGREGLDEQLREALMDIVCPKLEQDSLIIVDESDIEKPYAKKMEGCKLVHNGSKAIQTKGYNLLNILVCLDDDQGYQLLPVSSDLISTDLELDSIKQLMHDRLIDINIKSNGRGLFVFDRGYDDRKTIGFLVENGMSFIIRGVGKRNILEDTTEVNFKQVISSIDLAFELPGFKPNETFRCATRRIGVRTDDHPSAKANSVEASLVICRKFARGKQKGKDFYLICDFGDPELSDLEIIQRAISAYRKRWKIEEMHRQMKQDLQWEKMRVASYVKLKNLNMLMIISLYFIYSCKDVIEKIAEAFPKIICFRKKDWAKLRQFVYYRLCQVLKICLQRTTHYNTSPYRPDLTDPWQMKIRLV